MKIIDLTCFYKPLGIIFPANSGFSYTNQVGGACCGHPSLEGIYVPLQPWDIDPTKDPLQDHKNKSYEDSHVELVKEFLSWAQLDEILKAPTKFDFDLAIPNSFLAEAWVPVQVIPIRPHQLGNGAVLEDIVGHVGILTYQS